MSTSNQGFERDTLKALINNKRVWLVHVIMNALMLMGFFYWTQIPEETGWQFSLTLAAGIALVFIMLCLHGATFDYFRADSDHGLMSALRNFPARFPSFLLWSLFFGFVLWLIGSLWDHQQQFGGWARHSLPLFLRRRVTPHTMISLAHWLVWFLYYFVWPILFLPVGAQVARKGFRGFYGLTWIKAGRNLRFWAFYVVCFLA